MDQTISNIDFDFEIGRKQFKNLFFLVDGIYPQLSRFVKTISVPLTHSDTKFAKWQESVRKNVERRFGVLRKKFKFLQNPVGLHGVDDMYYVVKLCLCLHNAMVIHRTEVGEDPKTEQMYDIEYNGENVKDNIVNEEVCDNAFNDIVEEDIFFEINKERLRLESNQIDLS